jgi:D-sedoheptulose 7-phosphate isomerase
MNFNQIINDYASNVGTLIHNVKPVDVQAMLDILCETYVKNRMIFIFGNGGSAATSSHIAEDFSKGTRCEGKPTLRAVSLTDNTPLLTAISNDLSYEFIFENQLEIMLNPGDCVLAISASGNSPNVLKAVRYARQKNSRIMSLTGFTGGELKKMSDANIHFASHDYGIVEDLHLMSGHILASCMRKYIADFAVDK